MSQRVSRPYRNLSLVVRQGLRDLLVSEIPTVLHREIYATAAVAGAIVVVVGDSLDLNSTAIVVVGAIVTLAIRVISKWRGWSAPRPA